MFGLTHKQIAFLAIMTVIIVASGVIGARIADSVAPPPTQPTPAVSAPAAPATPPAAGVAPAAPVVG